MLAAYVAAATGASAACGPGHAAVPVTVTKSAYGVTKGGEAVDQYTFANRHGMVLKVMTYGGIVTALDVPDRNGRSRDIVLGFDSLADYEQRNDKLYFGALVGRYANRIGGDRVPIDGREYRLPANEGENTVHGGPHGFDTKVWMAKDTRSDAHGASVTFEYVSKDGENGFPGELTVDVTYTLTARNEVRIDYRAKTDRDTVVNLTNHTYFNLDGQGSGSVEPQTVEIAASHYTPIDAQLIPTGEIASVAGTVMDLRQPVAIGARIRSAAKQLGYGRGYDINYVLDNGGRPTPVFAARAYDPKSGRVLEIDSTQPGLQFYTGNALQGRVPGKGGVLYRQTDGFALEPEHFPDSPHRPAFPNTLLTPAAPLHEVTIWRFRTR
ncbi:galactose mutarotase [Paraburkholderia sp. 2C]